MFSSELSNFKLSIMSMEYLMQLQALCECSNLYWLSYFHD